MKITTLLLLTALICVLALPTLAEDNATEVTINLDDLSPEMAAQVLAAKDEAENGIQTTQSAVETAEEWVVFGEKFGQVIASICRELNIAVNDFIETPVGKITAFMIFWKVMGEDWWDIVGGSLTWMLITAILWRSFRHFHMTKKIVYRDGVGWWSKITKVDFVRRFEFDDNDWEVGSATAHGVGFAITTIICLFIVF